MGNSSSAAVDFEAIKKRRERRKQIMTGEIPEADQSGPKEEVPANTEEQKGDEAPVEAVEESVEAVEEAVDNASNAEEVDNAAPAAAEEIEPEKGLGEVSAPAPETEATPSKGEPGFISRVCFFGSLRSAAEPTAEVLNAGNGKVEDGAQKEESAPKTEEVVDAHKLASRRKKWLVCVGDDERMNAGIFRWVCSEYNGQTEEITVFTVVPHLSSIVHDLKLDKKAETQIQADLEKVSKERLANFTYALERSGIEVATGFSQGDAKKKIIEEVQKRSIDLLVLGRHPTSDNQSERILAWLGSVSEYCSRNASCATVVVKP